jgi:hypothetical protein
VFVCREERRGREGGGREGIRYGEDALYLVGRGISDDGLFLLSLLRGTLPFRILWIEHV